MIAFVFDRRSLVLLGIGAAFLALVLVAVGFLLGVQYGVLPPGSSTSAGTTAEAKSASPLPVRVTGIDTGAEPDLASGLESSDLEPAPEAASLEGGEGFFDGAVPDGGSDIPGDEPSAYGAPADSASAESFSTSAPPWPAVPGGGSQRTPAASRRNEAPADPIVDSRGGEPVTLAPISGSAPVRSGASDGTPGPSAEPEARAGDGVSDEAATPESAAPESSPAAISPAVTVASESGRYTVQVGAYRNSLNSNAMVEKLASRGFEAYVVEIEREGQPPLYAVRVGRFGDRASAAKAATALRSKAGVSVVVLSIG